MKSEQSSSFREERLSVVWVASAASGHPPIATRVGRALEPPLPKRTGSPPPAGAATEGAFKRTGDPNDGPYDDATILKSFGLIPANLDEL